MRGSEGSNLLAGSPCFSGVFEDGLDFETTLWGTGAIRYRTIAPPLVSRKKVHLWGEMLLGELLHSVMLE